MKNIFSLSQISPTPPLRYSTGFLGFDKLLGGGLVKGSNVLLAGSPGAGKSTILLQLSHQLANGFNHKVLYINAEENKEQIKLRAERLGINSNLIFLNETTDLEEVVEKIKQVKPQVVIVDSLPTLYSTKLKSAHYSPTQVKNSLFTLGNMAHQEQITFIFINHLTKEGSMAGLNTLQHAVDVTLLLKLNLDHTRTLAPLKNRYGSIDLVWELQMGQFGLTDNEPTKVSIDYNPNQMVEGRTITVTNEELLRLSKKSFWGSLVTELYLSWVKRQLVEAGR